MKEVFMDHKSSISNAENTKVALSSVINPVKLMVAPVLAARLIPVLVPVPVGIL